MHRTMMLLIALLGLSGCALIEREVNYSYSEDGRVMSVSGNVPASELTRTTGSLTSQQATVMAVERGLPVTIRDPYNGVQTTQVGGSMPYMYGYGGYGYGGYGMVGMTPAQLSEFYTVQRQLHVNPNAPPVGAPGYATLPSLGLLQQQVNTQGVVISEMVDVVD
jgi:hypothetical protein